MKDFRPAIIRTHENGYSERQIAELLSISKSTVHDDIQRYRETRSNQDRVGRGRKTTTRIQENELFC